MTTCKINQAVYGLGRMLRCLGFGLLVSVFACIFLPVKGQKVSPQRDVFYFECAGKKTQGSGIATGFPLNHPIRVQYKLNKTALTLAEIQADPHQLSAGQKPLPIKIYGNTLMTEFRNHRLGKDYEIQIRGDERLFSITIFPPNRLEPDTWYGQCINLSDPLSG